MCSLWGNGQRPHVRLDGEGWCLEPYAVACCLKCNTGCETTHAGTVMARAFGPSGIFRVVPTAHSATVIFLVLLVICHSSIPFPLKVTSFIFQAFNFFFKGYN